MRSLHHLPMRANFYPEDRINAKSANVSELPLNNLTTF